MRTLRILASVGAVALFATSFAAFGVATAAVASVPENPAPSCVVSDAAPSQLSCTVTYSSTGAEQAFTAPTGVTSVDIELIGASGGDTIFNSGGRGDWVQGTLSVSSAEPLFVHVGGAGSAETGGYNGGGNPGNHVGPGREAGGGGATDIRTVSSADGGSLSSRIAVAAGGGGASVALDGGDAGQAGEQGLAPAGSGGAGTQSAGGAGGTYSSFTPGHPGTLGAGGAGGDFTSPGASIGGGGGGGGLYGGGGGVSNSYGAGGGGSSLVPSGGQRELTSADPMARFSYQVPIHSVVAQAPPRPALQAIQPTATALSLALGHSADVTSRIVSVQVTSSDDPEGSVNDVSCSGSSCTSTRAGHYVAQAEFGAWHGPAVFVLAYTLLSQSIDFEGDTINVQQPKALNATATSGLPVSLALNSGPCTLDGNTLTAHDMGTCSVTASRAYSNPYLAAQNVTREFSVAPVSLVASSDPQALTATAGVAYAFPVELQDAQGAPVSPQPVIDYSFAEGCDFDSDNTATRAGECEVTATVRGSTSLTTTFTVEVIAANLAQLGVVPSARSVEQGGSLTFSVTGADAYGNPVDTSQVVLFSSVDSDVVNGLTVTFPHASPHIITATLGGISTSVLIEVVPTKVTPVEPKTPTVGGLVSTGADAPFAGPLAAGALLLLLAGAGLFGAQKLRAPRR